MNVDCDDFSDDAEAPKTPDSWRWVWVIIGGPLLAFPWWVGVLRLFGCV